MEPKTGTPSGAGAGEGAGGPGGGGDGTPSGSPAPGTGEGQPSGASAPGQARPSISVDVLPEQLRGQPEEVVSFTLNKMVESLQEANRKNRELEAKLNGNPIPGQAQSSNAPQPPKPEEPKPAKPLDEWILEDPEAALDHFVRTKYGSVFNQVNQVADRVGRAELASIRSEIEDFSEYEEEVAETLKAGQLPMTRENIMGAYVMAVGNRQISERQRARRAAANPERGAPESAPVEKKYNKTALSEEIRAGLGLSEEDYYEKFSKADNLEIKVPR